LGRRGGRRGDLGRTYAGGWRIMRTLGRRVIEIDPPRGFASETTAAGVLYHRGLRLRGADLDDHTISSAIMGAGATRRLSAVRWGVAGNIVTAWVLTIPMAGPVRGRRRTASPTSP
jgi:PiT family inorganic phosphate transporter